MAIVCATATSVSSKCIKKKLDEFYIALAIVIVGKGVVGEPVCNPGSSKVRESQDPLTLNSSYTTLL
jgi:hypothetical protein